MIDPISIGIWLLVGAAAGAVVLAFWKEIREWFIKIWHKLPAQLRQDLKGVLAFAQRVDDIIMTSMKYYSYNKGTNDWNETIVSKQVFTNEIPSHIRDRLRGGNQIDITSDLGKELNLTL